MEPSRGVGTPAREPLSPEVCIATVIQSTPSPSRFQPGDDPRITTLFSLGVVDTITRALFCQAVKDRLYPWEIDSQKIASRPGNTVTEAATSIEQYAF